MSTQSSLSYATLIALILLTSCAPDLVPGADLSGKSLKGGDLRGADLSGANLSGANLSNAVLGLGGEVKPVKVFEGITCAQWLKTSSLLAVCDKESVKIWDTDTGAFVQTIVLPAGQAAKVWAVSPNGAMLLLETPDSHLTLWDTKTNTYFPIGYDAFQAGYPSWSPDGLYLVVNVGGFDKRSTRMWDVAGNTQIDAIRHTFPNRSWSNSSRTLVYEGPPDTDKNPNTTSLELWDVPTNYRDRKLVVNLRKVDNIDWSPDDRLIVVTENAVPADHPLGEILDVESGTRVHFLENLANICEHCSLNSVAWSPTLPLIAGGVASGGEGSSDDKRIVFWDTETGSIRFDIDAGYNVGSLQWSENGRYLLGNDRQVWDVTRVLQTVTLDGANLKDANLSGANLAGLDLTTVTLAGAVLSSANLRGANLFGLDLRTVALDGADLSGANLANSDLSGVNLSGAIVNQVNFNNANLTGANLAGVRPIESLVKTVCEGIGMAQMPSYQGQPGIHPLVLIDYAGRLHEWNNQANEKWRLSGEQLPEIVACMGEFTDTTLGRCRYMGAGGPSTVDRLQASIDMTLRAAQTGSIIASTTIYGARMDECPLNIDVGATSVGGKHPQFGDAQGWLSEYVEK